MISANSTPGNGSVQTDTPSSFDDSLTLHEDAPFVLHDVEEHEDEKEQDIDVPGEGAAQKGCSFKKRCYSN